MPTVKGFNQLRIISDIATHLANLVPATLKTVTAEMTVRNAQDMRKKFPKALLPAVVVVDPPGTQTVGVAGTAGSSPYNSYQVDYRVGLIGLAELGKNDNPQDIVVPIFEAIYGELLEPKKPGASVETSSLARGFTDGEAHAINTYPESTAHSARTQGDRIFFSMGFRCPFEFTVEPD